MSDSFPSFDLELRTRVICGPGSIGRLGECASSLQARRALLVTDPGIVAAGHVDRALTSLDAAGVAVTSFTEVRENPTTRDVDACLAIAQDCEPDLMVAVGGGSSLDTAKGANFLITGGGQMEDYWGEGKLGRPMLPLLAVPTTAGTGSEVQSYALIAREDDHQKMACGDPAAAAKVAILDPELIASVPPAVAACTGIDALAHAVETAVTSRRNPVSSLFARESFRLILRSLPAVLAGDADVAVRGEMQVAAAWAGYAIEHSMLGASHSMANPLTAHHGLPHGQAVGMMLPHVVRFNALDPGATHEYAQLARVAGLTDGDSESDPAELVARRIEVLLEAAGMPPSLAACGVGEANIEALAEEAARQWTAGFNPRPVDADDLAGLYRAALAER
jgi:alcohol dehydrogenase